MVRTRLRPARVLTLLALLRPATPLRVPRASVAVGRRVALAHLVLPAGMAHAACLAGDTEVECIGVFKERALVSETDAVVSGVRYVAPEPPPADSATALAMLEHAREAIAEVASDSKANASELFRRAGVAILAERPRVSAAGSVVYRALAAASPPVDVRQKETKETPRTAATRRAARSFRRKLSVAVAALDDADLAIGEALRCEEDRLAVTTTVGAFEALATANAACAAMLAEVPKPLPPPVRRLPADFDDTLA